MPDRSRVVPGSLDSHTHLLHIRDKGLPVTELLIECGRAGMQAVFDIGVEPDDLAERLALTDAVRAAAERAGDTLPAIYHTAGLHPGSVDRRWAQRIETLSHVIRNPPGAVAIGEIGLDYHWDTTFRHEQLAAFDAQLALAVEYGLPVVIHNREADSDVIDALRRHRPQGVMHCFSQRWEFAQTCLDLGLMLSFAGNVTYKNAHHIQETAAKAPADRILTETDAPYLSPIPVRGRPNHPAHLGFTVEFIAKLRSTDEQTFAQQSATNAMRLFAIEPAAG